MSRMRLLVLSIAFVLTPVAQAAEEVFFAGFAYLGNSADIQSNFPYTVRIAPVEDVSGPTPLDKALAEKVRDLEPEYYALRLSSLADLKQGQSLSLALTLDHETVDIEPVCGNYKIVVDIAVQALVFDFEEKAIVGSYPMTVQYIDVRDHEPGEQEIAELVRNLYLGDLEVNVLDEFVELIRTVEVKRKYSNRIQVTEVEIGEKALPALPQKYSDNRKALETFLAQSLGTSLASFHGVSVLPYTKGHAIGNKMSTRFSNGEVYNLSIPEPDYHINLKLRGFKEVLFDKKPGGQSVVYGSYIRLKVFEPLSGKVYIDNKFKRGATKVIPVCQVEANDWPAYQESLLGLFTELSSQITERDRGWADSHAGDSDVTEELEQLNKVIQRCK